MNSLTRLLATMARLREPGGCPWDREQTPATLRPYVLEEAYEVAEALDGLTAAGPPDGPDTAGPADGGWTTLRDELGDLLLQVVFLARIAEEEGHFTFDDVAAAIGDKLVRRHPHVFAGVEVEGVAEVWKNWDAIKRAEHGATGRRSRLDGVPRHLPALAKARQFADKAARAGFDWPAPAAIADKIAEELAEIRDALAGTGGTPGGGAQGPRFAESAPAAASRGGGEGPADLGRVGEEIGDLVFAAASLARRLGLDPEACAESANRKFAARFRAVEALAAERGIALEDLDPAGLDALWNEAKREPPKPAES